MGVHILKEKVQGGSATTLEETAVVSAKMLANMGFPILTGLT